MSEFGGEVVPAAGLAAGDEFVPGPRVKFQDHWSFLGTSLPKPWATNGDHVEDFNARSQGGLGMRVFSPGNTFGYCKNGRRVVGYKDSFTEEMRLTVVMKWQGGNNLHWGFSDGAMVAVNDFDNAATRRCAIRMGTAAGHRMKSGDGSADSETDTGVSFTTGVNVYELLVRSADYQLFRNGVLLGTKTTNIPTSGNEMEFFIEPTNNATDSTLVIYEILVEYIARP